MVCGAVTGEKGEVDSQESGEAWDCVPVRLESVESRLA